MQLQRVCLCSGVEVTCLCQDQNRCFCLSVVADALQYMIVYQCILGEVNNVAFWVDGSSLSNLQVNCKLTSALAWHSKNLHTEPA